MSNYLKNLQISYVTLLKLPISKRIYVQSELISLRNHISYLTGEDIKEVQNKFEALAEKRTEKKRSTEMESVIGAINAATVPEAIIIGAVIVALSIVFHAFLTG